MEIENQNVWSDSPVAPEPVVDVQPTVEAAVETQAADESPTDGVQADVVIANEPQIIDEPAPVVTEKIIEKIIEKMPEFENEDAKSLFEAFQSGKEDDIYEYLSQKRKDFSVMSNYDVVKEGLAKANPKWTDKDVELELRAKYGGPSQKADLSELDPDSEAYDKAVALNERIDERETLLARDARDFRISLEEQKKNIQLPKIEQVKQPIETGPTQDQIAEAIRLWEEQVSSEVPKISDLKFNVNGEEVQYKITEEEKAALVETMKEFDAVSYLSKRGWFDQNGNPNVLKITEDVYQLENRDKMFSSVATKTKNATTKAVVADIKNVDLSRNGASPELAQVDAGTKVWDY